MKFRIFCLLLLLTAGVFAQRKLNVDSVLRVVEQTKEDTVRVKCYLKLYHHYHISDEYDSSMHYADKAVQLATRKNLTAFKGKAYEAKAGCCQSVGQYAESMSYMTEAAGAYRNSGQMYNYANAAFFLGIGLMNQGDYDGAMKMQQEALAVSLKYSNKETEADCFTAIGKLYNLQGNYPMALQYLFNAMRKYDRLKDPEGKAAVFSTIANVHLVQGNHDEALKMYMLSLSIYDSLNVPRGVGNAYSSIANCYSMSGNFEQALKYHELALQWKIMTHDYQGQAASYDNLGLTQYEIGSKAQKSGDEKTAGNLFAKALDNFFKAIRIQEPGGDLYGLSVSYENIGGVYLAQKRWKEAEAYSLKGLSISSEIGDLEGVKEAELNMSEICSATGRYEEALKHYRNHIRARDTLNNEENTRKEVQLQMQYDFDKKESEVKAAQEKKDLLAAAELNRQKKQRNYFIGGLVIVLLIAMFILYSFIQKRKANLLLEEKNKLIEHQKAEVEMKQKEIIDSIQYARRIQNALIPTPKQFERALSAARKRANKKL